VTVRIAGLGSITNMIVDEPADSSFIGDEKLTADSPAASGG
jgi:hypothetical protein